MRKRRKGAIPEVKARLLIAISDRIEHAAAALKKLDCPPSEGMEAWHESMQMHWGCVCAALLSLYESVEEIVWHKDHDNEQKLQELLDCLIGFAEKQQSDTECNYRANPTEETEGKNYEAVKTLAAIKWVVHLLYPNGQPAPFEEFNDGPPQIAG